MTSDNSTRAVLFDFDGTLGQSLNHWAEAYQVSLQAHGIEVDLATTIDACFNRNLIDVTTRFQLQEPHRLGPMVWEKVKERMYLVETYPLVSTTLQKLFSKEYRLGVVSNSRRGHISPVLDRWSVSHMFKAVVTIEDVSKGKPDPESIYKALDQLAAPVSGAWMVGDSVVDIRAGNEAGVRTIAFSPPQNHPFVPTEALIAANPSHIAYSYEEVLNIIEGLPAR